MFTVVHKDNAMIESSMVNRCHVCVCTSFILSSKLRSLYMGRHRLYHSRRSKSRSCIRTRIKDAILKFHGKNVNVRQVYDRSRRTWKNVDFAHISTHSHEYVLEGRQTRQIFKCNVQRVNEILLRTMYSSSTACIAVS